MDPDSRPSSAVLAVAEQDVDRILRHYLAAWDKRNVVLIGNSQGADVLPFVVNRLPPHMRARVCLTALLSLGVILIVILWPEAARGVLHGEPYRREMFAWIETGVGRENAPAAFVPQHLLHLGAFILLTWISGGYLGLALGAALVAYMSYFVGSYAVASDHLLAGSLAAWVPWSVLRVAAFVLVGAVFARPLLVRRVWPFGRQEAMLLALAASGIAGDLLIKALVAPTYGLFLRQLAGGGL